MSESKGFVNVPAVESCASASTNAANGGAEGKFSVASDSAAGLILTRATLVEGRRELDYRS